MREETSIRHTRPSVYRPEVSVWVNRLTDALERALALEGKLPESVLQLRGMSGRKYRRLVNALIGSQAGIGYLEVGSWAGSTACSAMHGNAARITCIDNWSEFGGPREEFLKNTAASRSDKISFSFIEQDFRRVDYKSLGRNQVYLFDGPHSFQDQYDGLRIAQPALDDIYVQIVDDWNWDQVRDGTFAAISDERLKLHYAIEIRTTQDGGIPEKSLHEQSEWHNGYFLGVIERK